MISLEDLKIQNSILLAKIKDPLYIQMVLSNHPTKFTKTVWAKDMAYSLKPLGLERLGFTGAKYVSKKPSNMQHVYEHKLVDDMIREVIIHDGNGQHITTDYYYRDGDSVFEVETDLSQKVERITQVTYLNNRAISSLRVDEDGEFWYSEYLYDSTGRVKQIISRQYNSQYGRYIGTSEVEYIDDMVFSIYHHFKGKRYNSYLYKG